MSGPGAHLRYWRSSTSCILQQWACLALPIGLYLGLNASYGRCVWNTNVVEESQHSSWVPVYHASYSRRLEEQISIARLLRTIKILHLRTGLFSRKEEKISCKRQS